MDLNCILSILRRGRGETAREKISDVAKRIVREFRDGTITRHELDPNGICLLGVVVAGARIEVTWYSDRSWGARFRSIWVDGKAYPSNGPDCNAILFAAVRRAHTLLDERMAELHQKMAAS